MASFPSATRALQFAAALQRAVGAHAEAGGEPLRVRVGVNAGEPIAEGDDLFGTAVILDFPPGFRAGIGRLTTAILGGDRARVAAAFRAPGFRTRDPSDESLWWLGEAFLGWAVRWAVVRRPGDGGALR